MILDQIIVQKILTLRKAYPSDSITALADKASKYFSHEEISERLESITSHWVSRSDPCLARFMPLFVYYVIEGPETFKFVLDKRDKSALSLWNEFCIKVDLPSYLKKWGSSKYKVYKEINQLSRLSPELLREGQGVLSRDSLESLACYASSNFKQVVDGDWYFTFPRKISQTLKKLLGLYILDIYGKEGTVKQLGDLGMVVSFLK